MKFVSMTLVKFAFVHLPFGASLRSTKYPVILLPPSNGGFCQTRLTEFLVTSETLTFAGGSKIKHENLVFDKLI